MIEYLIESTICFAVFFLLYEALFKHSTGHMTKRLLLWVAPIFSLTVPLLKIPLGTSALEQSGKEKGMLESIPLSNYIAENTNPLLDDSLNDSLVNLSTITSMVYIGVAAFFVIRFVWHLTRISLESLRSEKVTYKGHLLSLIRDDVPPFTFFQSIFVNKDKYLNNEISKELIIHEIAHKYQWHSIDIVFIELLQALLWFNPFIHFFKQRIKANHEYLADDFVLRCGIDSKEYATQLLNYTFPHKITGLASAFNNHKTIKNRLIMLSRFQEKRTTLYRLFFLLPVVSVLFIATAFNTPDIPYNLPLKSSQNDKLLENPGVLYADYLTWNSSDNEIYLKGESIKILHGDNNFTVNGRASYLGEVHYFVFNGKPVVKDVPIDVSGKKCTVVKLSPDNAKKKYGSKARYGAVEINVSK